MSAGPSTLWLELDATSPACTCMLTSNICISAQYKKSRKNDFKLLTCSDPVLKERPRRGRRRWSVWVKRPQLGVQSRFFEPAISTRAEVGAVFKTAALSIREEVSNSPFGVKSHQNISERSSLQATQCPRRTDLWCPRRTKYKYCSRCTDKTPYKSMFPIKEKFKKYFANNTNK